MQICFVMYPWSSINPEKNSTIRLVHECVQRGFEVAITQPENIVLHKGKAYSQCQFLSNEKETDLKSFHKNTWFSEKWTNLRKFDAIFMRADAPLNPHMLDILETVSNEVFVMNSVSGLKKGRTKIYTALNDDGLETLTPATYITQKAEHIVKIFDESNFDKFVLKPLSINSANGNLILDRSMRPNLKAILDLYFKKDPQYVVLQNYIESFDNAQTRVLMLDGKPISAFTKLIDPNAPQNKAAAKIIPHELTAAEKDICTKIGPKLIKDGLYLCGLEISNGSLVEIIVSSPSGISEYNQLNEGENIQSKIIDFLEHKVKNFTK